MQKTRFWTSIWLCCIVGLQCCQPYESRSVKNKAATNGGKRRAEHSPRRPSSVVRTRRRSVCDGRTRRVFLLKTDTTRTPDPIRPAIGGPDPSRSTNGRKQGGYDLGVFVPGGVGRTPLETNRRQQNRI